MTQTVYMKSVGYLSALLLVGCIYVDAPPPQVAAPAPAVAIAPQPPVPYSAPAYVPPPDPYQPPPPDVVAAYQPDLNPYGHWVYVPNYGQCWVPYAAGPGWQPYTVGHWVYSDYGWMWVSDGDETDWGPIVYHYGSWYNSSDFGWCWVPGTTWGPAWVAWREGNGYCGWAPLPPECESTPNLTVVEVDHYVPAERYVYVVERNVNDARIDQHIIRNNVTIINKTTNITNITVVNNRVVNSGVAPEHVTAANGRPVKRVAVQTVTTRDEAKRVVSTGAPVMYTPPAVQRAVKAAPSRPASGGNIYQRQTEPNRNIAPNVPPPVVTDSNPNPPKPPTPQIRTRKVPADAGNPSPDTVRNSNDEAKTVHKGNPNGDEPPTATDEKGNPKPKNKPTPPTKGPESPGQPVGPPQ